MRPSLEAGIDAGVALIVWRVMVIVWLVLCMLMLLLPSNNGGYVVVFAKPSYRLTPR